MSLDGTDEPISRSSFFQLSRKSMDPASAIGVASSVLSFINFSLDLISDAVEIHHSRTADATLSQHARLEDVVRDLASRSESMSQDTTAQTGAENSIRNLAEKCHETSTRLLVLLQEIKFKGRKRSKVNSLQAAFVASRKKKIVAELKDQLQGYRSQILLNLQIVLR